jgi:cardiolipin synthase
MFRFTSEHRFTTMLATILLIKLAGCTGLTGQINSKQTGVPEADSTYQDAYSPGMRRAYGVGQATQNFIQTFAWDPFFRPYSTMAALGSVTLKSIGASMHRAVATVSEPLPGESLASLSYDEPMDLNDWEHELDQIIGRKASTGSIRFLIDGEEFFSRLKESIASAQKKVHVRTYIFDNDDVSVEVADLLRQRSEDIDVRVLLDGVGTLLGTQVHSDSTPEDFQAPLSMTRYLEDGSRVRVRTHSNPFMTGDHVKSTIIDGELAFVGGMNIGREYRYEWHDMMMEVTGPVVGKIQRDADKAWGKAGFFGDLGQLFQAIKPLRTPEFDGGYPIRVLYTLPHDSQIYRAQLAAIRRARSYIFIENAYFSDDIIMYELVRARRRGVDVRVIIPAAGNHPMMNLSNGASINAMLAHGIRIYLYPGMSHIKAAVFDGWACVGSANFDAMSLRINREMNLATSDPGTVNELLVNLFQADFDASTEISDPIPVNWRHGVAEIIADAIL